MGSKATARLTADGVVTLCAEPTVGGRFRRRQISELNSAELPEGVSTLADLVQDMDLIPNWCSVWRTPQP